MEGGPEGVVAGVGGRGGGVSLRLLLLLVWVVEVVDAGRSAVWVNSSSSSREILR